MNWNDAAELTRKLKSKHTSGDGTNNIIMGILLGGFIFLFVFIPLMAYFVWSYAFVLKVIWGWLIVPLFGLPPLNWGQAWALMIVVAYLTHTRHVCMSKDERTTAYKVGEIVGYLVKPWVAFGLAWICKTYFLTMTG